MNRSSKLSLLVALALGSAPALALNLGQIQVKSALDRPLVAVIPLQEDFPGEANHLTVTLAPDDAFTRAGVSRANLKVPLTFTVTTDASGQKVIRVTSTEPVREPYLDFLVQVSWPKGKLLREYVVLLDPLSMSAAPAVQSASTPAASAPPAPAAPVAAPTAHAAPAPAHAVAAPGGAYGPVKPGDTLSRIAQTHAIDGVSYQQMLLALKATNPDAFFRNNVNALKAGSILRIPTREQALAVTPAAAITTVRQQNHTWQGVQAAAPTLVASAGGSASPVNGSARSATSGDRLKLVPPEAGSGSAGAGGVQATVTQLRQDLARSKEALSSQQQESADLTSRVTALQHITDQNKRLLDLKNTQIAELQEKLAATRKAAGLPAVAPTSAATQAAVAAAAAIAAATPAATASTADSAALAAAHATSTAGVAGAVAAMPGQTGQTPGAGAAGQTKAADAASKPRPVKPEVVRNPAPAAVPWYQQLWAQVVLAIIIIALLLGWFMQRRRKSSHAEPKPSLADSFGDSPFGRDADAVSVTAGSDEAIDAQSDPVYTADDDGEDELLAQLAEHPDSVDLHLELVSLYYTRGDVAQFESAAEAMHPYVADPADPEWQEVVAMGRELAPDHPLFQHADVDGDAAGVAAMSSHEDDLAHAQRWQPERTSVEPDDAANAYAFEEPPEAPSELPEFATPTTSLPDESEFDALPPLPVADAASLRDDGPHATAAAQTDFVSTLDTDALDTDALSADDLGADALGAHDVGTDELSTDELSADELSTDELSANDLGTDDLGTDDMATSGFTDDAVDTKLDLARAYIDMGDHDGAQAMLVEAINEGSQAQKEVAQKLLDELG